MKHGELAGNDMSSKLDKAQLSKLNRTREAERLDQKFSSAQGRVGSGKWVLCFARSLDARVLQFPYLSLCFNLNKLRFFSSK